MSSYGEGYATRSDEEGIGGIYGGNQEDEEKIDHGNTPVKAVEDDECELSSFEHQFSPVVTTQNLINQVSVSVKRAWTKSMRTSSDPLFRLRHALASDDVSCPGLLSIRGKWYEDPMSCRLDRENYWYEKAGVNFGQWWDAAYSTWSTQLLYKMHVDNLVVV
ncbi:hypothetical protein KY285_014513 [Solanum tuberosum]|nr:hypothetical protein KY284_014479 [Solanum tuberosum]KAH0718482.1 hypothetical protein KY285_014513 [Solanum tuberosum]